MASQVFYRKWRPQTLADVVGQEHVTITLLNALGSSHLSHAYLFCGPRGTGKTSTGRILSKAVNCLNNGKGEPCNTCEMCTAVTEDRALDIIEIDAASNRGIDEIRELRERANYAPNQARYKVYIIDEVHMLTREASNALLKTLEEPPPHVIFILATTEAHKVLPTIMSRCQRFDFRRITNADVVEKLSTISNSEGIKIEPSALQLIAKSTTGSLRDAENLLEQLSTCYNSDVGLNHVQSILGITGDWRAKELVKQIINNDVTAGIATINGVSSDGLDLRQFNRELVEYLRALLLIKTGAMETIDFTVEDVTELKEMANGVNLSQILKAIKLFGQLEFSMNNYSTLPLELALVDCILTVEDKATDLIEKTEEKSGNIIKATVSKTEPETVAKKIEPVEEKVEPSEEKIAEPENALDKDEGESQYVPQDITVTESAEEMAEEPSSEESIPAALNESDDVVQKLRDNWRQVIVGAPAEVKKTTALAIIRSSGVNPVSFENNTLVLSFKHDWHLEKMEKPENQQAIVKIISTFLGRDCDVKCIHEPESNHLVQEAMRMGAQITSVEEK